MSHLVPNNGNFQQGNFQILTVRQETSRGYLLLLEGAYVEMPSV